MQNIDLKKKSKIISAFEFRQTR